MLGSLATYEVAAATSHTIKYVDKNLLVGFCYFEFARKRLCRFQSGYGRVGVVV